MTRSTLALAITAILAAGLVASCLRAEDPHHAPPSGPTPDAALALLVEGNRRFAEGTPQRPHQDATTRAALARSQKPIAVLVSCSDSRVPPAVVFDQGLGDLFEIRSAGHMVDTAGLGSIEYAVAHLGTPLVVVMGHERCGAVTAALHHEAHEGHLGALVRAIRPSVEAILHNTTRPGARWRSDRPTHLDLTREPGNFLVRAIVENVERTVDSLATRSEPIREAMANGKVKVVGAYYDLDTGLVDLRW